MAFIKELPIDILNSIHKYCSIKFIDDNTLKEDSHQILSPNNKQKTFYKWYMEWLKIVYTSNFSNQLYVKQRKNNLSFINLVFQQFENELKSYINHLRVGTTRIKASAYHSNRKLEYYLDYANELCIEAYGRALKSRDYSKSELIQIIKECESHIRFNNLHQQAPEHNIVFIR